MTKWSNVKQWEFGINCLSCYLSKLTAVVIQMLRAKLNLVGLGIYGFLQNKEYDIYLKRENTIGKHNRKEHDTKEKEKTGKMFVRSWEVKRTLYDWAGRFKNWKTKILTIT